MESNSDRKEKKRLKEMHLYEEDAQKRGYSIIGGVDEAGRGAWAGPVVAAAVVLPPSHNFIFGLDDSKKLSPKKREELYEEILKKALYISSSSSEVDVIDKENILNATYMAMKKSIQGLEVTPDIIFIDGRPAPRMGDFPQISIIKGDSKSISIAAASIIAKVTRDRKMEELARTYPKYGFHKNKGYGTKEHHRALKKYGPSPVHRKSYKPVKELLNNKKGKFINLWNNTYL